MKNLLDKWFGKSTGTKHAQESQAPLFTSLQAPSRRQRPSLATHTRGEADSLGTASVLSSSPSCSSTIPISRPSQHSATTLCEQSGSSPPAPFLASLSASKKKLHKRSMPLLRPNALMRPRTATGVTPTPLGGDCSPERPPRNGMTLDRKDSKPAHRGSSVTVEQEKLSSGPLVYPAHDAVVRPSPRSSSKPRGAPRRPATADASGGPLFSRVREAVPSNLTAQHPSLVPFRARSGHRAQKSAVPSQEFESKLQADLQKVVTLLLPPPTGFQEDAFEERVDLLTGIVKSYTRTAAKAMDNRPGTSPQPHGDANWGITSSPDRMFERIEQMTEQRVTELLMAGLTHMPSVDCLRLGKAFSEARQQCGAAPAPHSPPSAGQGASAGGGSSVCPSIDVQVQRFGQRRQASPSSTSSPFARTKRPDVPALPVDLPRRSHVASLTPPPRQKRRPDTAPGGPMRPSASFGPSLSGQDRLFQPRDFRTSAQPDREKRDLNMAELALHLPSPGQSTLSSPPRNRTAMLSTTGHGPDSSQPATVRQRSPRLSIIQHSPSWSTESRPTLAGDTAPTTPSPGKTSRLSVQSPTNTPPRQARKSSEQSCSSAMRSIASEHGSDMTVFDDSPNCAGTAKGAGAVERPMIGLTSMRPGAVAVRPLKWPTASSPGFGRVHGDATLTGVGAQELLTF